MRGFTHTRLLASVTVLVACSACGTRPEFKPSKTLAKKDLITLFRDAE